MSKTASEMQTEILQKTIRDLDEAARNGDLQRLAEEADMDRRFREAEEKRFSNYSPVEWELKRRFANVEARRIEKTNNKGQRVKAI